MNPKAIYPILLKTWLKSASVLTLVTRTLVQANHHHHHHHHQHHHRMGNDLCALRIYLCCICLWCIYDVAFLLTDRHTDISFFYQKCAYWSCALKVVETEVLISRRVQLLLIVQYKLRYENSMWYINTFVVCFPAIIIIIITIPGAQGWHRKLPSQVQARCTCQSSVTVSCQVSSSVIIFIDENQTKPEKDFWLFPDFFCPSSSQLAGSQCKPHFCICIPLCNLRANFYKFHKYSRSPFAAAAQIYLCPCRQVNLKNEKLKILTHMVILVMSRPLTLMKIVQ